MFKFVQIIAFTQLSYFCLSQSNSVVEGSLLVPVPREDSTTFLSGPPSDSNGCGNTNQQKVLYITSIDITNKFEWVITEQITQSSCTFYLQIGANTAYVPLIPTNKDTKNGTFVCGTSANGIESANFVFNEDHLCETCVIRWAWLNAYGIMNQCADIQITTAQTQKSCEGLCKNNGVCNEALQLCECPAGYFGVYCQDYQIQTISGKKKNPTVAIILFLLLCIIILSLILLYFYAKRKYTTDRSQMVIVTDEKEGWVPLEPRKSALDSRGIGQSKPMHGPEEMHVYDQFKRKKKKLA